MSQFDCRQRAGGPLRPRPRCERRDLDQLRRGAIYPLGLGDQRVPAAVAHSTDDPRHRVAKRRILPPRPPVERARSILDNPHQSIIFSIGITRIADAPAAFSFSSVSQNTDSWHTAWTA